MATVYTCKLIDEVDKMIWVAVVDQYNNPIQLYRYTPQYDNRFKVDNRGRVTYGKHNRYMYYYLEEWIQQYVQNNNYINYTKYRNNFQY